MQKTKGIIGLKNNRIAQYGLIFGVAAAAILIASSGWADAFDSLSEESIQQKIGNIFKLIGGITAPIVIAGCLVKAGWNQFHDQSGEAIGWVKNAAIGGFLCLACWGVGQLMISVMK